MSQDPVGSIVEELGNCMRLDPSFLSDRKIKSSLKKVEWYLWCSVNHLEIFILEAKNAKIHPTSTQRGGGCSFSCFSI